MVRFIDIKTGNVFNAFGGSDPYIFWFDGEQSIDMIYTKPICFISYENSFTVSIPQNDVFKLLKLKSDEHNINEYDLSNINDFDYIDIQDLIEHKNEIRVTGIPYRGLYIYMFYIMCSSNNSSEYVESFYLTDKNNKIYEYKVGADFYDENEFHYINLSNKGIEIPKAIQKALYCTNVHEEKYDEIILNRKWKELLSNFWDVIDNKGSYKSLYNSLKWFEYGDIIKLFEIWRHKDPCNKKDIYDERDIKEVLSDKYFESINGFSKTTYIAISSALQSMVKIDGKVKYDTEKNPVIEQVVRDWSIKDLSLKLSMLGFFYKKFFMPIHLDLIRCTIEDVVYSNTIKLFSCGLINREDNINHYMDFNCNVKNGDVFKLGPVSARVGGDTLFANIYDNNWKHYDEVDIIGVQTNNPSFDLQSDMQTQIKTYAAQHFNGVGAIIDFDISLPLFNDDFIKRSVIIIKGDKTEKWKTIEDRQLIHDGKINFKLLCTKEKEYDIRLEFNSAGGYTFVKRLKFNVIDTTHSSLKLYKIQNIRMPDINTAGINEYSYGRMMSGNPGINYKQFIPMKMANPLLERDYNYKGVCLNHLLVLKNDKLNDYIKDNYFIQIRNINNTDNTKYAICLSKIYGFKPNRKWIDSNHIYKDEYVFYPDFHELVELGHDKFSSQQKISNYIITDEDAICVIPNISFGKFIEESQWEFINVSDPKRSTIIPPVDIKEPFIAPDTESFLKPGYYNIVFRYRLSGEDQVNTLELNSAFLKI
jgi:hypothetical protein